MSNFVYTLHMGGFHQQTWECKECSQKENIWCGTDFEIFDLSFEQFDVLTDYLKDLNI